MEWMRNRKFSSGCQLFLKWSVPRMIEGQMKVYLHLEDKKSTRMDWKEKCFSRKMNHILTCEGQNIFGFSARLKLACVIRYEYLIFI